MTGPSHDGDYIDELARLRDEGGLEGERLLEAIFAILDNRHGSLDVAACVFEENEEVYPLIYREQLRRTAAAAMEDYLAEPVEPHLGTIALGMLASIELYKRMFDASEVWREVFGVDLYPELERHSRTMIEKIYRSMRQRSADQGGADAYYRHAYAGTIFEAQVEQLITQNP